ncbi:MAG: hypothetical protein SGJ24_17045 [Chloroflexota bacterium]|nr:hypothetical protein [Chloroflexota bacterium]
MRTLRQTDLVLALLLALIAVALWLPFGFNIGFWMDGWTFFHNIDASHFYETTFTAPVSRPALNLVWQLAYSLDSESYLGVNLLLLALMIGKGWLTAAILHTLTRSRALACAVGALVLVLPADSATFYLGALTLHSALFCWLAATYCLLRYYETRRLVWAPLIVLTLLVGTSSYEIVFVFTAVGLLALLARARKLDRRFWICAWVYLMVPIVMGVRYLLLLLNQSDGVRYQTGLLDPNVTIGAMLSSLVRVYERHFWSGWIGAGTPSYAVYAIVIGAAVAGVCWWLARRESRAAAPPPTWRPSTGALIAVGVLTIALGVALYLPTRDRDSTLRTYYFSAIGAAVVIGTAAYGVTRPSRGGGRAAAFAGIVGAIALVGGVRMLEQHAVFVERTAAQQRVLRQFIQAAPAIDQPAVVLIDDSTGTLNDIFSATFILRGAVAILYEAQELVPVLCDQANCQFEADAVRALFRGELQAISRYERVVMLRYAEAGFTLVESLDGYTDQAARSAYAPRALIDFGAAPPRRAATMLPQAPTS